MLLAVVALTGVYDWFDSNKDKKAQKDDAEPSPNRPEPAVVTYSMPAARAEIYKAREPRVQFQSHAVKVKNDGKADRPTYWRPDTSWRPDRDERSDRHEPID